MDGQRIQNITAEGLTYFKDDGSEGFIDFAACREWYFAKFMKNIKWFKEENRLDEEQLNRSIQFHREWKVVGGRDFGGGARTPYIEFYTEPPTRFEFATENEFHKVVGILRRNGWRTSDLA